jgi:hypothetical protein
MRRHLGMLVAAGVIVGLASCGHFGLHAQDRALMPETKRAVGPTESANSIRTAEPTQPSASVHDALLRLYDFPFAKPTSLEAVCAHLRRTLHAPVVLDMAALERQELEPTDEVELELKGVRLKTGLKLLLDQAGLTYRVVAEDNLLVITDQEGSEDPAERIWTELRALHRDLHAVQDAVDELRNLLGDEGEGPRVHKPTIIEEMPDDRREAAPKNGPLAPKQPGSDAKKRQGTDEPAPGAKPAPSRVPLAGPRPRI